MDTLLEETALVKASSSTISTISNKVERWTHNIIFIAIEKVGIVLVSVELERIFNERYFRYHFGSIELFRQELLITRDAVAHALFDLYGLKMPTYWNLGVLVDGEAWNNTTIWLLTSFDFLFNTLFCFSCNFFKEINSISCLRFFFSKRTISICRAFMFTPV